MVVIGYWLLVVGCFWFSGYYLFLVFVWVRQTTG